MNWLERARREICGITGQPTADTAEGSPTAVRTPSAALEPCLSIGSNGSALPWQTWGSKALREAFEERAAIMEYDGGMSRHNAERAAWELVSKQRMH